jgi:hypothetical protein
MDQGKIIDTFEMYHLATYIKGPGKASQGQIEIEPIEYHAYSRYTD